MIPPKLRQDSHVRVVAPSRSRSIIGEDTGRVATSRLEGLGLTVSFGRHVDDRDAFDSSPVAGRLADLHDAFTDPDVDGVLTVIGGFNSNQLLAGIDWDLIAANPKVFCGFSDITALGNAMLAKTDLVTYSGPHWSTFGMERHGEATQRGLVDCLFGEGPIDVTPSSHWSDDHWFIDQSDRHLHPNQGWWALREGSAAGRIVGGNLCTLNLLQGTPFMPSLDGAVVFVEDDVESEPHDFDRDLQSLLHQPGWAGAVGLVIGRFQRASGMTMELLAAIATKPELAGLPVLANVDFGHTDPLITFPIGGRVELSVGAGPSTLRITEH